MADRIKKRVKKSILSVLIKWFKVEIKVNVYEMLLFRKNVNTRCFNTKCPICDGLLEF